MLYKLWINRLKLSIFEFLNIGKNLWIIVNMIFALLLEFFYILFVWILTLKRIEFSIESSLLILNSTCCRLIIKVFSHGIFHLNVFFPFVVTFGVFVKSSVEIFWLICNRLSCVTSWCEFIICVGIWTGIVIAAWWIIISVICGDFFSTAGCKTSKLG